MYSICSRMQPQKGKRGAVLFAPSNDLAPERPGSRGTGLIRGGKAPCLRRFPVPSKLRSRPIFIQTEQPPTPPTLKFPPGSSVMGSGPANFPEPGAAAPSPLAERLFQLPEVAGVFL